MQIIIVRTELLMMKRLEMCPVALMWTLRRAIELHLPYGITHKPPAPRLAVLDLLTLELWTCVGHLTHCCRCMASCRRPVNVEGATTHSRLRAAVSEWVELWKAELTGRLLEQRWFICSHLSSNLSSPLWTWVIIVWTLMVWFFYAQQQLLL